MLPPLSYALAKGTRLDVNEGALRLLLRYPLKTICIHTAWRPVFERLDSADPLPFRDLAGLMPDVPSQKIAQFLDQLVHKGFLERSGVDFPQTWRTVSIVIPVRNRPGEIAACLDSLQLLDYPDDKIEIIVVDDASDDATPDVVEQYPVQLIRLDQHRQASYCRNLGARHAAGDILAYIDSDCLADPMWLKRLLPAFEDPSLAAVGGRVDGVFEEKSLDRYEKAKSSLMVSSRAKRSQPDDPFFYVPACNFLVRRQVFLELGGFNTRLVVGEDVDLCWRLQKTGHGLEFRPDGTVYHKHRNDLYAFCRRRFDYGTSEPLLQKRHPEKIKQFVVPPAAAGFWGSLLLWAISGQPFFGMAAPLILLADGLLKWFRARRQAMGMGLVFSATVRSTAAFFYHLCAFVSRYYLMAGLLAGVIAPALTLAVVAMHLLVAVAEHRLKKAALGLLGFVLLFTFEQLAYQTGVWWGCVRHRIVSPLVPRFSILSS